MNEITVVTRTTEIISIYIASVLLGTVAHESYY